jgi:hypothetical protein
MPRQATTSPSAPIGNCFASALDMINVSSFYLHTVEWDIEGFKARTSNAKIYGEMTNCDDIRIAVWLNGKQLEECEHDDVELFPPIAENAGYATRDAVKFYAVPLDAIVPGRNTIELKNLDKAKRSCKFFSLEIGLYTK